MSKKTKRSKVDQVFSQSDKHTLADLALEPWTDDREWTAGLLGMTYPNLGKEGRDQLRRTTVYREAVKDVSIFLYLSTLTADEVEDAARSPEEAYSRAKQFAVKRGIHRRDSDEFWDAYNKFWEVMNEVRAAATRPKSSPGAGNDEYEDDHPKA